MAKRATRRKSIHTWEHRGHAVAPFGGFLRRLLVAAGLWLAISSVGLLIGIAGYAGFEGMSLVDAYMNAAMILSGMGPMGELHQDSTKIFAGIYALVSGLLIFAVAGVALAPVFHRMMHRFHLQDDEQPPKKKGK